MIPRRRTKPKDPGVGHRKGAASDSSGDRGKPGFLLGWSMDAIWGIVEHRNEAKGKGQGGLLSTCTNNCLPRVVA